MGEIIKYNANNLPWWFWPSRIVGFGIFLAVLFLVIIPMFRNSPAYKNNPS